MPTKFNNAGFGGFGSGIGTLRRRQVTGDGEFNPVPAGAEGTWNPEPSPIPGVNRTTPTPRATATPRSTPAATPSQRTTTPTGDNSGAGLVNPRLFRQDNTANRDFWETSSAGPPNRPHVAMDFDAPNTGATVDVFRSDGSPRPLDQNEFAGDSWADINRVDPAAASQYPATDSSAFSPLPTNYPYGEPTVQTPTYAGGSTGNLDTDPSLFDNVGANAFDQWWKTDPITASADVSASANAGGSIWSGDTTLSDFGSDLALGDDFNADLGSLGYGEDYPVIEAPADSPSTLIAEGTGIPIEPNPLNQDYEWTTSPEDRRFLPQSEVTSSSNTGGDINAFGTHGSPLSLGAFLNASLSSMRFGENRFVSGGDVTTPFGTEHTPGTAGAGDTSVPPPSTGQVQIDPATGRPYDLESIPEGVAVSPEVRRGELVSAPQQRTGLSAILQQFPSLNNPASIRAINNGASPSQLLGRAQFDNRAANAMLMSSQAFGGNANAMSVGDAGRTYFDPMKSTGRVNEEGMIVRTPTVGGRYNGWSLAQQRADVARTSAAKARGYAATSSQPVGAGG